MARSPGGTGAVTTKRFRASSLRRTVYLTLSVFCAANVVVQLFGLLQHFRQPADFEHVPWGVHVGASLFVAFGSAGFALLGISAVRARLDVDTLGMRRERAWFSQDMDVSWDAIAAWSVRVVVTTFESNDGWNAQITYTTQNCSERLEIAMNCPPRRITWGPGAPFYRAIVEALRAHAPDKEGSLPMEKS